MIIFYSFFSFGYTAQFLFAKLNRRKILRFMHMHCCAYQTMHHVRYAFKSTFIFFLKQHIIFVLYRCMSIVMSRKPFFFASHFSNDCQLNLSFIFFSFFFVEQYDVDDTDFTKYFSCEFKNKFFSLLLVSGQQKIP